MAVVDEEMTMMQSEFKTVAQKFGEDAETFQWEELFALLLQFHEAFEVDTVV
jgi:hypothetical protein